MEIYRVENRYTHRGPFCKASHYPNKYGLCVMKHRESFTAMPGPVVDGMERAFRDFTTPKFAFPSIALFIDFWTVETLRDLQELDHVLVTMDVPEDELVFGRSGLQVAFDGEVCYPIIDTKELVDTYMVNNFHLMG